MSEPLEPRELDAFRDEADRFIAELDEEDYLHFAGLKDTLDLVPIYERHAELTALETALAIGASVDGRRNTRELWKFACEGYLGNFVREEAERVAELEASLKATSTARRSRTGCCGRDRRTSPTAPTRERLEQRAERARPSEHLNPLYLGAAQVVHREA